MREPVGTKAAEHARETTEFHDLLDPRDPNTPPSELDPINRDLLPPRSIADIEDPAATLLRETRNRWTWDELRAAPTPGQGPASQAEMILRLLDAIEAQAVCGKRV